MFSYEYCEIFKNKLSWKTSANGCFYSLVEGQVQKEDPWVLERRELASAVPYCINFDYTELFI